MAKNPHFRILALTATPGGNPDAVQRLIDGLHISHIEIRDENSLDLKPFIHHKRIEQHIITMTEDVNRVKGLLAALMDRDLKPLRQKGILYGSPDPVKFHPYSAQARMNQLRKEQKWAYLPLSRLGSLARAMGYLIEGTSGMCYTYLQELSCTGDTETTIVKGKAVAASRKKSLREDPMFQAVLGELNTQQARGFSVHPKMDRLRSLIIQHFAQRLPDEDNGPNDETRAMVFVTFREAVDEIVDILNFERPLIRAHKFIGQGTDKQGKKGLAQKEQLGVVQKFKAGEFNVLVATSIGEEGLDIGEVDLIVCYDAQKTPIRMLQRLGRTGRKRAGVVHVLLAEGREELNLEKAKDTYKEVQKTILRGEQLEFYTDVPRLLPDHVKPVCLEKAMEIQEYVRDEGRRKSTKENRSPALGTKRKRNDNISRNIPAGASTGFVSVADLLIKQPKRQKKTKTPVQRKDFDNAGEDDDTDLEIESGIVNAAPRRARSFAPLSSNHCEKATLRRARTTVPRKAKGIKQQKHTEPSSSQFSNRGVNDVDDVDTERGPIPYESPSFGKGKPGKSISLSSPASSINAVIDLTDSEDDQVPVHERTKTATPDKSMAWLLDGDEDENPNFEVIDSSPIANRIVKAEASATGCRPRDSDTPDESIVQLTYEDENGHIDSFDMSAAASPIPRDYQMSSPLRPTSSTLFEPIACLKGGESSIMMPPPPLPQGPPLDSPDHLQMPQPSFPVRPLAPRRRRRLIDSPGMMISSPRPRRLHHRDSPKPGRNKTNKVHINVNVHTNPVFDIEAEHSGDDTSEGSSGPEDKETEEDRRFLEELPETQVSPSYDQTLAYRQSLFTQAPMGAKAPAFINAPVRRGVFGVGLHARRRPVISSSPPSVHGEPDQYILDSFVVDDDAEISYLSDD
ncbi:hypothetical protein C0993_007434 [Termitomyces sp. T159_Od127]|nr:hypothetical protein C0993_007434 [Termitomyces sp. T159_Od127]